ncbi:MAG: hypothetical protein O2887_10835 [Bacteroidetes bacterium]|nr:hypothetical protein [Bacteroidota bacterium]MDA1120966.1 hypothetical protein [Bacteroidota bacterium]
MSNLLLAQDSNDPLYHERETEEVIDNGQIESRTYFTEETTDDREGHNYYTEVKNKDSQPSAMLTYNFLFYMVYKLKFSDSLEETHEEADDD